MSASVKRIELPSGRWWEIEKRPRWKHLRAVACLSRQAGRRDRDEDDLANDTLAALTTAWGFEEPVCAAAMRNRAPDDLAAALAEALPAMERLLTARERRAAKSMALFEGLMRGRAPEDFEEVRLMSKTGWTWQELQDTPADVVELMSIYLSVVEAMETGGSVEAKEDADGVA